MHTTEEDLMNLVSSIGPVERVQLNKNGSRCFAFVDFKFPEDGMLAFLFSILLAQYGLSDHFTCLHRFDYDAYFMLLN